MIALRRIARVAPVINVGKCRWCNRPCSFVRIELCAGCMRQLEGQLFTAPIPNQKASATRLFAIARGLASAAPINTPVGRADRDLEEGLIADAEAAL